MPTAAEVIARRRADQRQRLAAARAFVDGIDATVDVRAAVVFGSVARGDFHDSSDTDVLVVAAELPSGFADRLRVIGAPVAGVDAVAWTPHEWVTQREKRNPIAAEAVERGVWLRGEPGQAGD